MMNEMIELYPADAVRRETRRYKLWRCFTVSFALAALAACVVLVCKTNTANAPRMQWRVCELSAVSGCVVIFLCKHFVLPGKREILHLRTLRDEERQAVSGKVSLLPGKISIPGSVRIRKLQVRTGEKTGTVNIGCRFVKRLPKLPAALTLYTVHGYVIAWEVRHEAD